MLKKILDKLRNEPVRVRVYSVAALVLGFLLTKHVLGATDVDFILSVLGIILGVETARAKVTPYNADAHDVPQDFGYDEDGEELSEDELNAVFADDEKE